MKMSITRNFYYYAIFFAILYMAIALLQSIIYFQLAGQTYTLQSFPALYACFALITVIGSLFLLKYYHHRKYDFAFWAIIIATLTALFQFTIVFNLMMGVREMANFYIPVVLATLAASILYGLSLAFSDAGKRPWLKAAGFFTLVLGVILVSAIIWSIPPDVEKNAMMERITKWTSLASSLAPIFLIMNFLDELKYMGRENANSPAAPQRSLESMMGIISAIAFATTLFLGVKVARDSKSVIAWNDGAIERGRRLAEPFEARTYVGSTGDTMRYRLLKPVDYDSTKTYPLVVCLHHGGTHGTDNLMQIDGAQIAQVLYQNRTKYPAFLFVPQCPKGAAWGGIPNYPAIDSLVFETIDALEAEFKIDEQRRYVAGVSGGGFGSWHFIGTRPQMFAAAIPICGGGNPDLGKNITDVAVWAFHGEKDRSVPVQYSRDMIAAIKTAGGDPKYTEFAGAGHNIWDEVYATPGLLNWLFEQRRE
jgi:pimeloyl-ACP methyl ester carboxylesterase